MVGLCLSKVTFIVVVISSPPVKEREDVVLTILDCSLGFFNLVGLDLMSV